MRVALSSTTRRKYADILVYSNAEEPLILSTLMRSPLVCGPLFEAFRKIMYVSVCVSPSG